MPAVGIVSGQTFEVTLQTGLADLGSSYSTHRVYYKKPSGETGFIAGTVDGTDLVATVPVTTNTLADWGLWKFYAYCEGAVGSVYRSEIDTVQVNRSF